ncbi:MAG: DMT family transporter [Candidatus Aminicenantes bacterium]|nr:DMT family transporter [Candidatus Aminicenantes bacterium]
MPESRSPGSAPRAALAAGVLCIGFSALFVRWAAVPGVVSAFYRVLIASAGLLVLWLVRGAGLPDGRTLRLAVLAGVFFGVDLALWNSAVMATNVANATVLAYLAPVWVGLAALVLFKEKLKKAYWPGMALALLGMIVILGLKNPADLRVGRGEILAVAASFFYAGYLLTAQEARRRTDTLPFTTVSVSVSAVLLFLVSLLRNETLSGFGRQTWLALLGAGLISHLGGWLAINYALGHMRASVVSVTLLNQPVVTALAAWPLLGEPLGLAQVAGGVLILAGVFIVHRS